MSYARCIQTTFPSTSNTTTTAQRAQTAEVSQIRRVARRPVVQPVAQTVVTTGTWRAMSCDHVANDCVVHETKRTHTRFSRMVLAAVGTVLAATLGGWLSQQLGTQLTTYVGTAVALPLACLLGALITWGGEQLARNIRGSNNAD